MLAKIKLALISGVFALGLTACGGSAGEALIAKGTEAVTACKAEKDAAKRGECVTKALEVVSKEWTEAATAGDITVEDTKAFTALTELSQKVIEGK